MIRAPRQAGQGTRATSTVTLGGGDHRSRSQSTTVIGRPRVAPARFRSGGRRSLRVTSSEPRHSRGRRRRPFTFPWDGSRVSRSSAAPSRGYNPTVGRQWIEWAGMRSLLAILIFFALAEPAAACRRFSIWHYNFPQPCLIARPEAQTAPAPAAPDIPCPP
jgi:hypothetical protein